MKLAAAQALAELVGDDLAEDVIIPSPFDPRVGPAVAAAVAEAARARASPGCRPAVASVAGMFAVYAESFSTEDPLSGLVVGERPEPEVPDGWTTVEVRAASLNHHDLFSLRGVGLKEEQLPMILGTDAAGIDEDGNEVVVHGVISDPSWTGDETFDPRRSLLSERYQGAMAERVAVPRRNVVPKPASLSFAEAACLPTAWLTAYRMLFTRGVLRPGETVLVQGAGGGVATAAIVLARAAGLRVLVTSRDEGKRAQGPGDRRARGVRVRCPAAREGRTP